MSEVLLDSRERDFSSSRARSNKVVGSVFVGETDFAFLWGHPAKETATRGSSAFSAASCASSASTSSTRFKTSGSAAHLVVLGLFLGHSMPGLLSILSQEPSSPVEGRSWNSGTSAVDSGRSLRKSSLPLSESTRFELSCVRALSRDPWAFKSCSSGSDSRFTEKRSLQLIGRRHVLIELSESPWWIFPGDWDCALR